MSRCFWLPPLICSIQVSLWPMALPLAPGNCVDWGFRLWNMWQRLCVCVEVSAKQSWPPPASMAPAPPPLRLSPRPSQGRLSSLLQPLPSALQRFFLTHDLPPTALSTASNRLVLGLDPLSASLQSTGGLLHQRREGAGGSGFSSGVGGGSIKPPKSGGGGRAQLTGTINQLL